MKKSLLILAVLALSFSANAQMTLQSGGNNITFRKSPDFNDDAVSGSKYFDEKFSNATVNKGTQNFQIRYNAYSDLMEYKNGADLLELIKEQNTYFQFNNGDVYELMTYNVKGSNVSRYNQVLVDKNNIKVSKFKSIKLVEAKAAANSYDTGSPAAYKPNKEVYYVTLNNETTEFDGKQKTVEKMLPSKSAEIKKFFKENRIKENDADMIKLGNFLATL